MSKAAINPIDKNARRASRCEAIANNRSACDAHFDELLYPTCMSASPQYLVRPASASSRAGRAATTDHRSQQLPATVPSRRCDDDRGRSPQFAKDFHDGSIDKDESAVCGDNFSPAELAPTEHNVITSNRRWREEEFLLPSRLTRGHDCLAIRIEHIPDDRELFPGHPFPEKNAWSESRYWAYCYRLPDAPPASNSPR